MFEMDEIHEAEVNNLEGEVSLPIINRHIKALIRSGFVGKTAPEAMSFMRTRAHQDIETGFYSEEGQSAEFVTDEDGDKIRVSTHELTCLREIATTLAIRYFKLIQDFCDKRKKTNSLTPEIVASIKAISVTSAALIRQIENTLPGFKTTEENPDRKLTPYLAFGYITRLIDFEKVENETNIGEKNQEIDTVKVLIALNTWKTMFVPGRTTKDVILQVCKNGLVAM